MNSIHARSSATEMSAIPHPNVRKWYVAYTAARAEKRIADRLLAAGIEHYLPLRREYRLWSDRRKLVHCPVFPSYIFVRVNPQEYYTAINVSGMVRYIHFGGNPAVIGDQTMEAIRKMAESGPDVRIHDQIPEEGEIYRIQEGWLKGIEGKLIRIQGGRCFVLEVEEWGKYLSVPFSGSGD